MIASNTWKVSNKSFVVTFSLSSEDGFPSTKIILKVQVNQLLIIKLLAIKKICNHLLQLSVNKPASEHYPLVTVDPVQNWLGSCHNKL